MSGNFLLTVDEAASVLRCSADHIYRLIEMSELEAMRVGKSRPLILRRSLVDFIQRRKNS